MLNKVVARHSRDSLLALSVENTLRKKVFNAFCASCKVSKKMQNEGMPSLSVAKDAIKHDFPFMSSFM